MDTDYGSTDLKDLEAIKPNKKEKRPPTSSLIVVLLQGVMQVGGFTAIIPTAMADDAMIQHERAVKF